MQAEGAAEEDVRQGLDESTRNRLLQGHRVEEKLDETLFTFPLSDLNCKRWNKRIWPRISYPKTLYRWNTVEEIFSYLISFDHHQDWISTDLPDRPPSGTILVYDKSKTKDYRSDGYDWKLRRGTGKTIREDRMKLKVSGFQLLYGCYTHSASNPNFHRRSYWLIQNPDLILVHYLDVDRQPPPPLEGGTQQHPSPVIKSHLLPSNWEILTVSDCNLCALMNMVHSSSETQVLLKQLPVILRQNILKARGDLAKSIELNNASLPFDKFDEPRSKKQRSLIVTDKKGNGSCGEQTRAGSLAAESRRREDYSGCYPGERAASIKDEETKMVPMGASEGQENSTSLEEVSQALPQTPQVIVCFPQSGGLNYVVMNGSNLVVMSGEGPPNAGVPTPHKKKGLQKGNGGGLQNGGLSRKMEAEDVVAGQDGTMATSSFGKGKEKATDHCVFELSLLPKDFTLQSLMPPLDGGDTANRSPGITATKASPSVSSGGGRSQRYSWPSVPPPPPPPPPPGVIPCSSEMPSQLPDNRLAQTDSRAEDYDPEKFTRFANFLVNMEPLNGINQGLMDSWSASEEEEEDVMDMEKEEEKEEGEEVIVDDMNLDASLQALADRLRHRMFPVMGAVDPTSMAMISTSTAPQSMNARTTTTTPTSANARITQGNEREHPAASPEVHIPEVPMSWLVHPSEVLKRSTDSGVDTSDEMADVFVSDWTTPHHVYTPVSLPHTKDNAAGVSNTPPSTISSSPSVVPNGGTELDDSSLDLSPDTLKLLLPFGAPSLQKSPPSGTIRHPESNSQMLSPLSQLLESFVPPVISDDEEAANISGGSDDRSNPTVGKANNSILPGPGATLSDSNVSVLPSSPLIPPPTASQEPTPIAVQQSSTNDPNLLLSKSHPEMMQTEPRCSFSYHHQQQQPVPNSPFSVELPTGMEDFLLLSEFQTASCSSTSLPSVVVTSSYQSTHQHNYISSAFDDATSVTSGHPRPLPQIQSHVCPTTFHSQTPVYHGLHSVPPAEGLLCNNDLESIMSVAQASCADDTIQFDSSSFSTIQNHTSASKSREASSLSNHGNYGALLGDCVDLNPRTHSDTVNAPIRPQRLNAPSLTVSSDPPGTSFLQASSLGVPGPSSQNQLSPHSLPDLSYFTEDYIHRAGSLSPHLLSSSSHPSSLRSLSPLQGIREGIQMELQSSPTVPAMQLEESDMMDFGALEQYQASSPIPSSPSLASISSQSTASVHDLESFFASSDSPSVIELCELLSESPNVQRTDFSHMTLSESDKQQLFKSAEIIQNAFRTYKSRRARKNAALTIENHYKRYKEVKQRKDQAARRIQHQYRVYKYRIRELNRAALFIQQMYRFHHRQKES